MPHQIEIVGALVQQISRRAAQKLSLTDSSALRVYCRYLGVFGLDINIRHVARRSHIHPPPGCADSSQHE